MKKITQAKLLSYYKQESLTFPIQFARVPMQENSTIFTGHMKEELQDAYWVAKNYLITQLDKVATHFFKNSTLHLHMPYGLLHKKGPSGGLTILVCLYAMMMGMEMRSNIIFSGEISLNGNIYPIGKLYKKVTDHLLDNFETIVLPAQNKRDLPYSNQFLFIDNVSELLDNPEIWASLGAPYVTNIG